MVEQAARLIDYIVAGRGSRRVSARGSSYASLITAMDIAAAAQASPVIGLLEASRGVTDKPAIAASESIVVPDESTLIDLGMQCSSVLLCTEKLKEAIADHFASYKRTVVILNGDLLVSMYASMLGEYASRSRLLVAAATSGGCLLVAGGGEVRVRCRGRPSVEDVEALAQLVSYLLELRDEPPRSGVTAVIVELGGAEPIAMIVAEDGRVVDGVRVDERTFMEIEMVYSAEALRSLASRLARLASRPG